MSTYASYWRVLDHHDVLHLANSWAVLGECLCGFPPFGTRAADPVGRMYPPGALTGTYRQVCPVCNDRAVVGGPS